MDRLGWFGALWAAAVLIQLGLRDNTIVVFMSDNGPWNNRQPILRRLNKERIAWGSSGRFREGKGSTYEGGFRIPCIVRWPNHVPAGRVSGAMTCLH